MIERRHARLHAVSKLPPGPPRTVVSDKTRIPGDALRMVAPQQMSHARKLESPVGAFNKYAHAGEASEQAIEPVLCGASFTRNIAATPPSLPELVGDAEFNYGPECLTDPLADHHLEQDLVWTGSGGQIGSAVGHMSPLGSSDCSGAAR